MSNYITTFSSDSTKGKAGETIVKQLLEDKFGYCVLSVEKNSKWRYRDVDFLVCGDDVFDKKFNYSFDDIRKAMSTSASINDSKLCRVEVKSNLFKDNFIIEDISKIAKKDEHDIPTSDEINNADKTGWFYSSEADFFIILDVCKIKNGRIVNWKEKDFDTIINNAIWLLPNNDLTKKEYEEVRDSIPQKRSFSYGTRDNWFSYYRSVNINIFSQARRIK